MKGNLPLAVLFGAVALGCGTRPPDAPPLGAEVCDNGKDDNGDGKTDCADPKCFSNAKCSSNIEKCDDGVDNDGNGQTDCGDPSCEGADCASGCSCKSGVKIESSCGDHSDNDADGQTDCADSDCATQPPCNGTGGGSAGTGGGSGGGGGAGATGGGGASGMGGGTGATGGGTSATGGGAATGGGSGSPHADGAPCTGDGECQGGLCLTEAAYGFPRGMCSGTCSGLNTGCHGGYCSPGGHCYASCVGNGLPSGCRAGFACSDIDGTKQHNMCVALCSSDAECSGTGAGYGCNPWSGYCESKNKGKLGYGAACTNPNDCESGLCIEAPIYPGGYCGGNCRGDLHNCGPSGYCHFVASNGDNIGSCRQSCTTLGAVCRSTASVDYSCVDDTTGDLMGKNCICKFGYYDGFLNQSCASGRQCCSGSCGLVYTGFCD